MDNKKIAREYASFINQNRDLVSNASLLFELKGASMEEGLFDLPQGVLSVDSCLAEDIPKLYAELLPKYRKLMRKAKDLPASNMNSDIFYRVCDAIWELDPILRYRCNHRRVKGPDIFPGNSELELALSIGYTNCLLGDLDQARDKVYVEYIQDNSLPSVAWANLVRNNELSEEEMRYIGRNLQKFEAKILEAATFGELPPENPKGKYGYVHEFKNLRRSLYGLREICYKLGIPVKSRRKKGKRLDDPTLFER